MAGHPIFFTTSFSTLVGTGGVLSYGYVVCRSSISYIDTMFITRQCSNMYTSEMIKEKAAIKG